MLAVGDAATATDAERAPYDAVVRHDDPRRDALIDAAARHPLAAAALAVLLRQSETLDPDAALAAESAVYSTLQAGPEFAAWRRTSTRRPAPDEAPAVLVDRDGGTLDVVLNRPHRHNAVSAALRDGLVDALAVAVADDSVASVRLSGAGPSFCSGGDLGEFGSFPDPATAHVTRLLRSPARLLHRLAARLHAHVHGACLGAGVEWPAFAGSVTATFDATFGLPELALGLVPGAGGTVSLPRRIGRHRTMALALSGQPIDAATALRWGLVDEIRNC